jgi:hypothetical protein
LQAKTIASERVSLIPYSLYRIQGADRSLAAPAASTSRAGSFCSSLSGGSL